MQRHQVSVVVLLGIAAGAGAIAAAAQGADVRSSPTKLIYSADPGEANRTVIAFERSSVTVKDAGTRSIIGCIPDGALNEVRCPAPNGDLLGGALGGCDACQVIVTLADGNDSAAIRNAPQGTSTIVTVDGGEGDDTLASDAGAGTVAGGAGNDTLTGRRSTGGSGNDTLIGTAGDDELTGGPGADVMTGNGGADTASYFDHAAGVRVALDDRPNDGADGEGDDVRTENVRGGSGDDALIGNGADNVLDGLAGADRLSGGAGADTLTGGTGSDLLVGGAGNDLLRAADRSAGPDGRGVPGSPDTVRCGAGDDSVQTGREDAVALDCEHIFLGPELSPSLAIAGPSRVRLSGLRLKLAIQALRPPTSAAVAPGTRLPDGPQITGTAIINLVGNRRTGAVGGLELPPLRAPNTIQISLPVNPLARRQLRRRGRISLRVRIDTRDAFGNESITRRLLTVLR